MSEAAGSFPNIHATAVAIAGCGFLIVGPSGSGKSSIALALLSEARQLRLPAALVADDQVLLSTDGGVVTAHRPATIAGLIEIRGAGIGQVDSVETAAVQRVLTPFSPPVSERLPEENACYRIAENIQLPIYHMGLHWPAPLTVLDALIRYREGVTILRAAPF